MELEEVFPAVQKAIAQSLGVEAEQIGLDSRLVADLGMESLDFIDLIYELEQAFNITIPMGNMEYEIERAMEGKTYEVDGILTPEALAKLREIVPGLVEDPDSEDVAVEEVPLLLTVRSACGLLINEKERQRNERGP
jgi:acyl carrier protein